MFCYEIMSCYIFPLLNSVSAFCLASQKASLRTVDILTNLFGGRTATKDWDHLSCCLIGSTLDPHSYLSVFEACRENLSSNPWDTIGRAWHAFTLNNVTALEEVGLPALQD
ncbi:hypothetical protein CVT25_002088 [Psilocybe cyanescens]|uniref:Uncharacterized protein n=1 Tax=Psilocybe cyanescens TaxID=93625 RepID=A0A409X965_PSICY|nr:hypothetical protein CVT25_002088 [Psilocybe cyanescens]